MDSSLAAKMSKSPPRVPWRILQHWYCKFGKNDVEGLPYAGKNPLQLPMDSREGSIVSLSSMTRICSGRTGRLRKTAHSRACHGGQCKVLPLQPFRSVLDPIRGHCCFLSFAQIGKIQEVTDQRMLPILWRLN